MSKIGINIKLDVKKLDKARFFAAQSGALYVDITMFLDPDNEGQFGDHGFATQSCSKEEREGGVQMPIIGNGKIFYGLNELKAAGNQAPQQKQGGGFQPAPQQSGGFQAAPAQQGKFATQQQAQTQQQAPKVNPQEPSIDFDDDIPF